MDSSDEEFLDKEKAGETPSNKSVNLPDSSLLASYIFIDLGNSILHSPEVQKKYYEKKGALVNKLRSDLVKKKITEEDFEPEKKEQLIDALIALKFNDSSEINMKISKF